MYHLKLFCAALLGVAMTASTMPAMADTEDEGAATRISASSGTKMRVVKKRSVRKRLISKALRHQPQSGRRLRSIDTSDWDVLRSGGLFVVSPPEFEVEAIEGGAGFASVGISVNSDDLFDDDAGSDDSGIEESSLAGIEQVEGVGMKSRGTSDGCPLLANGSGWMMPCWTISRSKKKVAGKYLWALSHYATFKSTGLHVMRKARIRATPRGKTGDYRWVAHSPAADVDHGNCSTVSLSVGFSGASVGISAEACDKWDIDPSRGDGVFDNTWHGDARRTERNVAYAIMIKTSRKKGVRWETDNDWCTRKFFCRDW